MLAVKILLDIKQV